MAKNQTLELSILIGGHVDNSLTQAVKSANTQLSSMANGASKLAANIAKVTVGIASGITAGLVDATKEAVAFESEMLDVTKYVGGLTDANGKVKTDAYAEMSKDILDLSTQIPYTAKELTRLAAAAGQSGKSMDDLISGGFLKDVAEMGTAMDISADQAGDWAAKWEVAFNINHDQVMELADQINYLGAHYATTAAEIAQTVNDTGSLGQIAGMDVQSTAALSTALLAMGVDSGKVATSIRRMYTNLSMGSKATDAIIGTLNKLSFTVPDWVPALGGKQFGFNLKEVAMPAFANGGFTHGVSIAGEAGTEAVISFKPSVHDSNVENWVRAGRMLGVSGEDATRAAGVRCFANGGFTDGSKEKLDNLIDFSKAYGKYALRSNGIRTTGDALSMLWTVANNSMSGDASLALAATSLAADVAPLLLNKYLGSDSPVTTALTEAAKNYNGGTVLSSWQDGVLTDTGTPLYVLPPRDTGRTLSEIPVSAYQNTPVPGGNGGSSPQFVFAPNITITGDADRQQIASIMEDEYEKFKAFMDKYNRENNRTRYA